MTTAPDMLFEFGGAPVGGARFSSPWATHWFVDGTSGHDSFDGKSPETAKLTIQAAVTASTGGDVIYIRPKTYAHATGFARYTEDVVVTCGGTAGSGETATNAGKSIIGVTPRKHPSDFLGVRWIYATNTNLNVEAAATHIENIGFFAESGTYAIYFEGDGGTWSKNGYVGSSLYNCAIKGAFVYANGANELQIINCRFQAAYDGVTAGIELVGSTNQVKRPIIQGCEFIGGNAYNMDGPCIIGAAPWYDAVIRDCYFNADPDGGIYINIAGSSSTGIIANCYFANADISTDAIVEGGLISAGCYDTQGIQSGT